MIAALPLPSGIVRAARIGAAERLMPSAASWSHAELAGRFTELSGLGDSACLTLAIGVVHDAQRHGEPAAWVTLQQSCFNPRDAWDSGVDLDALVVVRVPDDLAVVHAADRLARSGSFGALVLDLGAATDNATALGRRRPHVSMAMQARLRGLAQHHDMAILCLTRKNGEQSSLGSLVSLHGQARRHRQGEDRFVCALHALKDKQRGPGWTATATYRGPSGLH